VISPGRGEGRLRAAADIAAALFFCLILAHRIVGSFSQPGAVRKSATALATSAVLPAKKWSAWRTETAQDFICFTNRYRCF